MFLWSCEKGLREASQIFKPLHVCEKVILKHSTAEIQTIQQFWLQLDIVSEPKKKIKNADTRVWGDVHVETRIRRLIFSLRGV